MNAKAGTRRTRTLAYSQSFNTPAFDCSFCLARQSIAFRGGDNDANGNNLTTHENAMDWKSTINKSSVAELRNIVLLDQGTLTRMLIMALFHNYD